MCGRRLERPLTTRDPTHDILDAAAELAAQGGFEQVRLRDVAAKAGVALATLYKRFPSKEALLAADVARRSEALEIAFVAAPPTGATPRARLVEFFTRASRQMIDKPGYGRAVIRAMASGPESARSVVIHQGRMVTMVLASVRGVASLSGADFTVHPLTEREQIIGFLLLQIWFATLVGWSAGLSDAAGVDAQMARAIDVVLAGA